jgi:hypothetical protein
MNKKILVITGLLIGSCFFTAQAQQLTADQAQQEKTPSRILSQKHFTDAIKAYEQVNDEAKATRMLEDFKHMMQNGIAEAKHNIVKANESKDPAAAKAALELHQQRADIYNRLIKATATETPDKNNVIGALKSYAETIK